MRRRTKYIKKFEHQTVKAKIKLVVFDWNGALFADNRASYKASVETLKVLGLPPVSFQYWRDNLTFPTINYYLKLGAKRQAVLKKSVQISKAFDRVYDRESAQCRTRSGAKRLLSWLDKKNIKAVLLSNHTHQVINGHLKRLKLEKYFDEILAFDRLDECINATGKLERLKKYLQQAKYDPQSVAVVGDAPEEVEMGKTVGAVSIGITDGYYSTPRLKASKPDYLISNLTELIRIIKQYNN